MHFISGALAGHRQRQVLRLGENPHRRRLFRLHRSALTDKSRAFRISPNDHVEPGDGTVQLTFTAECGCSAAKCRKIIRLQLNDAIIADNWLTWINSISSAIAEYFLQIM